MIRNCLIVHKKTFQRQFTQLTLLRTILKLLELTIKNMKTNNHRQKIFSSHVCHWVINTVMACKAMRCTFYTRSGKHLMAKTMMDSWQMRGMIKVYCWYGKKKYLVMENKCHKCNVLMHLYSPYRIRCRTKVYIGINFSKIRDY